MAKESDLPHNLVGFACDPVSEQIIWNVIKEKNMAYSEARSGGIEDIIAFLKTNRTPKILIVDISNSELPLSDINKIKEFSSPNVNIIVIGGRNEVGLFRDLLSVGVVDYIVKPLSNTMLIRAIDEANGQQRNTEKTGKVVYVVSSVGGAGATTSTINIAWILANHHFKRTLVMDTDFLYGTANLMLDLKAENAYLDLLESPDKIDDYFVETILRKYEQRLYYLGGLADLVRGVVVDIEAFTALMDLVKHQFNYVLLDAQRDVSPINRVCMSRADSFLIMVEMTLASAQNTARLLEFLTTDQGGKKVTIVANKVGLSASSALTREAFEKVIDRPIDYVLPLDESVALAAANIGQPLAMSGGPLTDVFEVITDDILGKNESVEVAKALREKEGTNINTIMRDVVDFVRDVAKKV